MSLNLQYRPKSFDELSWQRHISDIIKAQLAAQKFSHTYLLYGPRGTGKTTTARLLAKAVNIPSGDLIGDPIATLIDKGQTIDYVEIDAASHTGVDNIRDEIIDKALYPPTQLKRKVYVIDEVHMLSKGAFNALLKIMEEPPEYLMFILATTEIHKVPDTIVSRSQVFNFKRLTIDDIVSRMEFIAQQEHLDYDVAALRLIAKMANWGVRDGIKYLEQISMLGKVTEEVVSGFLGVVSEESIVTLLEQIAASDFTALVKQLDLLQEQWADLSQLAKDILRYLDEHFMEDPARYSQLAKIFKDITIGIKSYPHPIIIYKMYLWEAMQVWSATQWTPKHAVAPELKVEKPAPKVAVTESKEAAPASVSTETPPAPAPITAEDPKSEPVFAGEPSEFEWLMAQLIDQVDKVMIKSILKKSVIVDGLEDDVLSMIIINEQYYSTLNKQEIIVYLQDILWGIRGRDTKLKLAYMNKEAYLQRQLAS